MKRLFALLLALSLALSLAGCGNQTVAPSPASEEPAADEPVSLTFDELNVEFVVGVRDAAKLMALQKELPPLLIDALADEGCTVEQINVTFGASADATVQALHSGAVDIAFLPSETCVLSDFRLRLIALENTAAPAAVYFPDLDFSALSDVATDSGIYENAVVLSGDAPDALCDAFSAALVALCADAEGSAAMQRYGCASYLVSGDFGALLAPLIACLTLAPQA